MAYVFLRGKAMAAQVQDLSLLMQEIALITDFDNKERIVQLASQARSGAQSALISSGHMVANAGLAAQGSKAGWLNGGWGGASVGCSRAEVNGPAWRSTSSCLTC